ncbi:MAG: tyrosine transporter [Parachlamydiaceae bacterium]|nr:tyrosine transporter [Parachlamydiaceae bacterium]
MNSKYRQIGGILLVSGTTIGAGMLALPVVTGLAGFFPSLVLFIIYWLFMTFTAFLILEVNLWMGEHTNLVSMARATLGKSGATCTWVIYLFLLYTLTTAYIAGSGPIFIEFVANITGWKAPIWMGPIPLLTIFGFFVYQGTKSVDYVNRILMLGLAITFIIITIFLTPNVQANLLEHMDWKYIWMAVSIVSTSFGFHIIIPTLTDYLHRDVTQLRRVILIGSCIPLFVYIIWEILTLGIIPLYGPNNLVEGYQQGLDGATILSNVLGNSKLAFTSRCFSLFAIITSFLGVSLSLSDFLADGFKIRKTAKGRGILYLLTFVPPLLITLVDPRAFLHGLEYAGAFGVVTLLGLLPVLMVWSGRYYQKRESNFTTPGGKVALTAALLISLAVIGLEVANKANLLPVNPVKIEQSRTS